MPIRFDDMDEPTFLPTPPKSWYTISFRKAQDMKGSVFIFYVQDPAAPMNPSGTMHFFREDGTFLGYTEV